VGLNHIYIGNSPYNPCLTPSDTVVQNLDFWIDTLNGGDNSAGIYNYNPTGIFENSEIGKLQVQHFPNPASESMLLQINNASQHPVSLKIFSASGAEVLNFPIFKLDRYFLKSQDFPAGLYLIEIERNGYIYRNKIAFE
jgi:hypothetical protein